MSAAPESRDTFLTDTARRLLDGLPPFLQGAVDVQGSMDALAMELDRLEARMTAVLDGFFPLKAVEYLFVWEALLGLPMNPPDKTLAQRRVSVLGFLQGLSAQSRLSWQDAMTKLIGTSWSYQEHNPNDNATPPAGTVRITIPFTDIINVPGGLTSVASAGGAFAAGTYFWAVTAANFYGETTASATVTRAVTASQRVTLDWNDVPGATGYRVYRGTSASDLRLVAAAPASTYIDTGTATSAPVPSTNNTDSFKAYEVKLLARKITPAHLELQFYYDSAFIVGIDSPGDTI